DVSLTPRFGKQARGARVVPMEERLDHSHAFSHPIPPAMKTRLTLCLALVSVGSLLTSCSKKDNSQSPGQSSGKQKIFVMIPKGVHPYYEPCYEGFKDAGAKYGVKTEYLAAKAFEVPQEVEIIENVIARHVDGIAISALDDQGLVPAIEEATKAGIKVITFDAPAPSSKALTYIGTMNEAAGYSAAEQLIKIMNNEGEVAVLQGGLGAPNLNDRFKGFERC